MPIRFLRPDYRLVGCISPHWHVPAARDPGQAQIIHSARSQRPYIPRDERAIAAGRRGYQELSASSPGWQSPLQPVGQLAQAVRLCIAALGVNVRICRMSGALPDLSTASVYGVIVGHRPETSAGSNHQWFGLVLVSLRGTSCGRENRGEADR